MHETGLIVLVCQDHFNLANPFLLPNTILSNLAWVCEFMNKHKLILFINFNSSKFFKEHNDFSNLNKHLALCLQVCLNPNANIFIESVTYDCNQEV